MCVLTLQIIKIDRPYTGHFASYQGTVMGGMAQNMLREDFSNLLYPKTNAIVGGERSLHLNQYPLPSLIAAGGVRVFGGSLEVWGRIQAVFFNFLSALLIGLITKKLFNPESGILAFGLSFMSPFSIIYGQAFMSESSALCFLLAAVYFSLPNSVSISRSWHCAFTSGFFFSLALVSRVHWLVFYPFFLVLYIFPFRSRRIGEFFIFGLISVIAPLLWYGHTYFAALESQHVHTNLFMQLFAEKQGSSPEQNFSFQSGFYLIRILFTKMLTPVLAIISLYGFLQSFKQRKNRVFLISGTSTLLLIVLLAMGKVMAHDFYLFGCYPFFVMAAAYGLAHLIKTVQWMNSFSGILVFGFLLLMSAVAFSMGPLFASAPGELQSVKVARDVRERTLPEDQIIIYGSGPGIISFYAERASWSFQPSLIGKELSGYSKAFRFSGNDPEQAKALEEARQSAVGWLQYLIERGADYLIIANPPELEQVPALKNYLKKFYTDDMKEDRAYYLIRLSNK